MEDYEERRQKEWKIGDFGIEMSLRRKKEGFQHRNPWGTEARDASVTDERTCSVGYMVTIFALAQKPDNEKLDRRRELRHTEITYDMQWT
jgi:hypothetical protein